MWRLKDRFYSLYLNLSKHYQSRVTLTPHSPVFQFVQRQNLSLWAQTHLNRWFQLLLYHKLVPLFTSVWKDSPWFHSKPLPPGWSHRFVACACIAGRTGHVLKVLTRISCNTLTLQLTSMPQLPRDSIWCRVVHTRSVHSTAHWFSPSSLNLQRSKPFTLTVLQEPGPGLMTCQAPLACTDKGLWNPRSWQTSQTTSVTKPYDAVFCSVPYIFVCFSVFHIQLVTHFKKHPRSPLFWGLGQFSCFVWCIYLMLFYVLFGLMTHLICRWCSWLNEWSSRNWQRCKRQILESHVKMHIISFLYL